jgi:hypothetical protein
MRTGFQSLALRAGLPATSWAAFLCMAMPSPAVDCNGNGVEDAVDLNGTIAFPVVPHVAVKGLTNALVAADLDGDSDVDLAAGSERGTILVFPLREEGETGPRLRHWPAVSRLTVGSVAAADIDGDGDIDLAASGAGGTDGRLGAIPNRGDGSFELPVPIILPRTATRCVTSGDIDADGDLDLAAAVPFGVHVFPNIGGVEFGTAVRLPVGSDPHAVRAEDLDADGLPDLVTANSLGGAEDDNISVFRNGGERGFLPARNFATGRGTTSLDVKDIDGDGDLDVAVVNAISGTIRTLLNDGKANLSPRELFASERPLGGGRPVLLLDDLDRDGAIDIALAGDSVFILLFQRMGAFLATVNFFPPRSATPALATTDLDGDGDRDLAFTDERGLGVVRSAGAAAYEGERLYSNGNLLQSIASGDLDSDGDADLAMADRDGGHVALLLNDQSGGFAGPSPRDAGASPLQVALGDLDADGDLDAATANRSAIGDPPGFSASLLLNDGRGAFAEPIRVALPALPVSVTMARIDADDLDDLVFTGMTDRIDVRLTNLDRTFRTKEARVLGNAPRLLAEDFDGDGDVDLAALTSARLSLLTNDGDGELAPPLELIWGDPSRSISAGDLNADGLADLVTLGLVPRVLMNLGGGRFDAQESPNLPSLQLTAVRAADLDGDLDQDVVASALNTPHSLNILVNRGDGKFWEPVEIPGLGRLHDLLAVDLNGDDLADIAGCEGGVMVLLNETLRPRSRDANRNGIPDECEETSFRRGDADGSGGLDITDPVFLLGHLFRGLAGPPCEMSADADDDGALGVTDAIRILGFLFRRGEPPPGPFPGCGVDPTPDALGCSVYEGCP